MTGRGGGVQKREGGDACEVLPLRKRGGGGKSFNHSERGGGHTQFWGSFYVVA